MPVRFYVPAGFSATAVLPPRLWRYADCVHYLLHLIVRQRVFDRSQPEAFVPLLVRYLRNVIPRHVEKQLRAALIAGGVIECDRRYLVGAKAMGYRLASAYQVPAGRVTCTDARLAAKVRGIGDPEFRRDLRLPVHRHLHRWLQRVRIDRGRAEQVILATPHLLRNADVHLTAAAMIDDGALDFCYCRMGRVHTKRRAARPRAAPVPPDRGGAAGQHRRPQLAAAGPGPAGTAPKPLRQPPHPPPDVRDEGA